MSIDAVSAEGTGPGGTEFFIRAKCLSTNEAPRAIAPVSRPPEHTASRFRQAVEGAKRALVTVQNVKREDLLKRLEIALQERRQFWTDTCREVLQMRAASPQVLELHRQYGCRFCVPASGQVQSVLDALDSARPDWDREHPELFYRTLELNFPELPHRRG